MANTAVLVKRFEDLETQLGEVEATKRYEHSEYFAGDRVDSEKLLNWQVKARHLLSLACGADSVHLKAFLKCEEPRAYRTNYEMTKELKAIYLAAKEDFEGGFMTSVRQLVQAEVFDTELDQARELLAGGYATAAAVITGVVLETAMRDMCSKAAIAPGSLNKMNADLTKAGVYNLLTQKRITAMADIRNNAAHGNPGQFQPQDVTDMIAYVESFLAQYL
ncbi:MULTISPECIES: DUF4145 domain-containing protein [Rhizobium/Agrobacterium group]|uniref:DUF4145 domain-containing protein n=1 Tax=Rhizobium rhizogenes TaxID=359 RepID=A0A546X0Y5_RHIRH|nr:MULTISPECIES: DUF4145 domain-containing protein [Rhizobium/Agrobacterium group]TRA94413.1 DUF4145 domain-containing protein [Rhizobium rhizogenes]